MKLTNYMRDSIIRSVMNEVPEVKYPTFEEIQQRAYKAMPPKLKAVYNDETTRKAIRSEHIYINGRGGYSVTVGFLKKEDLLKEEFDKETLRNKAREELKRVVYGCNTLKQLQEQLPQLEKHFPSEQVLVKNLPVVATVMPSLKAAGWVK